MVFCVATAHADTSLPAGQTNIDTTGNPDLGIITRVTGATALFNNSGTATAPGTALVNGILGPWATIGTGTNTRYATLDGSNNVAGYAGATALSGTGPWGGIPSGTSTTNYDVSSGGTFGLTGLSRNINTFRYTGSGATQQSNFGGSAGADIFTVNGIMNAGSGALNIGSAATGTYNGLNILIGASQELALSAVTANIVVENIIKNNGTNPSAVTVTGGSSVILGGANTFSGGLFINSGNVERKLSGTLGTGTVNIGAGSTLAINGNAHAMSQAYSGAGSITNTVTNTVTGNFSGFSGTYTHNSTSFSSVFNTGVSTSANAAYVIASTQGSSQGFIAAGAGNYTLQMGSLSGVADSLVRGGGFVTGTTTLEVGNLNTSTTFSGAIANGTAAVDPKILALTKVGDGTLTLGGGGANTYTGATLVSAGTLLVNGSLGNTAVTVEGAAIIGGTGALGGSLHFDAGSFLTIADLNDAFSVTGTVTFGSGFGIDNLLGITWGLVDNGTYTLLTNATDFSAAGLDHFGIGNAYDIGGGRSAYFQNGSLQVVVIPEPGAALLGGLGMLAVLRRRRV